MPEAATPVRAPIPLEPFEGTEVIASSIAITKAGDGLSDALSVEPQAFHLGEKLYVVLECDVAKVRHSDVKDTGALRREHTFQARGATIVDATLVADLVQAQKDAIRVAKEKAAGIEALPFEDEPQPPTSALDRRTRDQLFALCDANGITVGRSAKKDRLVSLLRDVPGIEAAAESYDDMDYHDPHPDSEASVTSLADHRED